MRGLCFLFLKARVPVSSPLTLKSYDSDFRSLFYKDRKLLFPLLKAGALQAPPLKPLTAPPRLEKPAESLTEPRAEPPSPPPLLNLSDFQKNIRLQKSLERHIQERLQNDPVLRRLSPASCCRRLSAVKAFTAWLFKNGCLKTDFRRRFKSPRLSQKAPDFLSADEALCLFKSLEESRDKKKGRDRALFCLLYGGGLRVSEACHIRNKDFREEGIVEIQYAKGGRPRLVSLPKKPFQAVQSFREERLRANGGRTEEWLFGPKPLSARLAYNIIRRRGAAAGLLRPLHPHALRHSFATHLLSSGADLRSLQELLGHKTLTAVQKYTHLDMGRLSQTLEECHPLNRRLPDQTRL